MGTVLVSDFGVFVIFFLYLKKKNLLKLVFLWWT